MKNANDTRVDTMGDSSDSPTASENEVIRVRRLPRLL